MKKLILTLFIFLGLHPLIKAQNVLDMQSWTMGTGTTGAFNQNGKTIENERIWGEGPQGQRAILWEAKPEGESNDDGGFNHSSFAIDHTKMYRFSIWLKKTNSTDGISYFGTDNVNDLNGGPHSNPYFWSGDLPELNKWYLLVGYVHGSGDASTTYYGGIYDGSNGTKVVDIPDYQFAVGATWTYIRAYLYYDTNVNDRQYFYAPRVEVVNGDEPSIKTLLATTSNLNDRTNWSTSGLLKDMVVTQLGWRNYGNNHTIIDMSNGIAPNGTSHNAENAEVPWQTTFPSLMGWNGTNTFGIRVENAKIADNTKSLAGVPSDFSGYGNGIQWLVGSNNSDGKINPFAPASVKSFLATTLQDVTAAGNISTNNIRINSFQNAIPELGALNYKLYLANDDNGYGMQFGVLNVGDGYIQQQRGDGGATAYNLLFNPSGGNVGIGTTLPSERLTVNGKIKANEIRVNGNGAPDYVFEESYKIGTLEELEAYIKKNKHLPEIPSAKEFERDGIAVGDMNKLLLKKIEELTLHLIEKDKALKEQLRINKDFETRLLKLEQGNK
ncbi:hypothetical protein [Pedobacter miscanthi]|uniref:hypothetical protein n=1 Tax=Pedobacter miscanthi TaxID=2259170 RepID=UPI00292CDAAE|nr:hypothetical protein [Pedobacter miscanthi]